MSTTRIRRAPTHLAAALLATVALVGCGRTMTDDDCKKVADNMLAVWQAEAKKSAPESGPGVEKAAAVIKSEGEKLVGEWSAECKKELVDRRVDPRELDCLLGAKTIEQINKCAEL